MIPFARFGVYLHFPYCLSKCPYCDFASQVDERLPHRRYADAVCRELELRAPDFAGRTAETLYLGGGTPSLWDPACLADVLGALRRAFPLAPGAEVTLEANPGAADAERFAAFRALGVNRLSIGVQSFAAPTLEALGRRHTGAEAERAFDSAREAGFDNVSLDLLYGSAGQTVEGARADARRMAELGPEHVSAYALTLEAQAVEVPMAKQLREGTLHLPDDEATADMGEAVRDELGQAGYQRYEISNYTRGGRSSRHNALYWRGGEYLALGCGATGYSRPHPPAPPPRGEGSSVRVKHFASLPSPPGGGAGGWGLRYTNTRSAEGYLRAIEEGRLPEQREELTADDLFTERLMLGLRLVEGVDLDELAGEFDRDPDEIVRRAQRLLVGGWARLEGRRLSLTERGLDVHTEAAVRLI